MLQVFEYIVLIVFHFLIFSFSPFVSALRTFSESVKGIENRAIFGKNSLFSESDRKKNVPKTYKLIDKGI